MGTKSLRREPWTRFSTESHNRVIIVMLLSPFYGVRYSIGMTLRCKKCGQLTGIDKHTCPVSVWNKNKKGLQISHNKGKILSVETKEKISISRKKLIASGKISKPNGVLNGMYKKSPWNKGKKIGESPKKGTKLAKHIREKNSGSNHYRWNGGYKSINMIIRKSYEYKQWVQKILKRDRYTCQDCMHSSNKLEVHHIKQFAIIVKDNCIKNFEEALKCNELWDAKNAITLCKSCHKKTDSYLKNI